MAKKKPSFFYKICKRLLKWFYPKTTFHGTEYIPDEPVIFVGNHTQMNSPLICEFYFPIPRYTWCAGAMFHLKDVPAYAFQDFWSQKPKWTHPFYKVLSYLIAPVSVFVFNNADTVPVYRDTRIISTFKNTVNLLQEGKSIVIFPEHDVKRNNIIYEFESKFIDVAKLYYKRTGKQVCFMPMYAAPRLRQVHLGEPVRFNPDAPMDQERERICNYLMDQVTQIARDLPEHTVVPYRNIPKKLYPSNKEAQHENTCG